MFLELVRDNKIRDKSATAHYIDALINKLKQYMQTKLNKTDAVKTTEVIDNHYFVETDKGNFIAIRKHDPLNTVVFEHYDGDLKTYLNEWDLDRPKGKPREGCLGDLLPGYARYNHEAEKKGE